MNRLHHIKVDSRQMDKNKKKKNRTTKIVAIALWVALLALITIEWQGSRSKGPQLKTARVAKGDLEIWVSATGKVQSRNQVEVKSKAGGEIKAILVEEGDQVEKGTLLVRIDPRDQEIALRKAQSTLKSAQAQLARARSARQLAERQLERGEALFNEGFLSQQSLDQLRTDTHIALNAEKAASADMAMANENFKQAREVRDDTQVVAPMSGTILKKFVEVGQIISSGTNSITGGTPLILIADLYNPDVLVSVDESDVGGIEIGKQARFTVDAYSGQNFTGEIELIQPIGTTTVSVTSFAVMLSVKDHPYRERLRPGMTADVEILSRKLLDVVLVPASAVRNFEGNVGVWVQGETGASFRIIKLGATDGLKVEVLSGVSPGDMVLTGFVPEEQISASGGCKQPKKRSE